MSQIFSCPYSPCFPLHCLTAARILHAAVDQKTVGTSTNQTVPPSEERQKTYKMKIPDVIEKEEMQVAMTSVCVNIIPKCSHSALNATNFFPMFKCQTQPKDVTDNFPHCEGGDFQDSN